MYVIDRLIFLMFIVLYLLSPSFLKWWTTLGPNWHGTYLIWSITIIIAFMVSRGRKFDEL